MKYVVIDANSSYFDENLQEFDYSRGFVVEAKDQATACELAKKKGSTGCCSRRSPSTRSRRTVPADNQIKERTMTTATSIRRILPNGKADCSTLRRVARVYGVLQWEDTNELGNVQERFGVHNTREFLPVPDGWMRVELE